METVVFDLKGWRMAAPRIWSRVELCKRLGLSRWTIKRMEDKGEVPRTIELACKALENEK